MKLWTVTINDDGGTPSSEVFTSERKALEWVLDVCTGVHQEDLDDAFRAHAKGDLAQWLEENDYVREGDSYLIESHDLPLPALDQVASKLAELRVHTHAISLHSDCLGDGELMDRAWELACGVDAIDRELNGWSQDAWLATEKEAK